jgi:hypothetical protein
VVLIERAGNNKPRLKHKGKKYQQNTLNPNHSEIKGVTPVLNGKVLNFGVFCMVFYPYFIKVRKGYRQIAC